jgi:hypothetical protein
VAIPYTDIKTALVSIFHFSSGILLWVTPQLTVVIMNTISHPGAAAYPNGAHVAWVVSNAVGVHETTIGPGQSNNDQ